MRGEPALTIPRYQPNDFVPIMPKSKILIADDNLTNVELLEAYLDGLDCETAVAVDGRDTLAKVAEFQPDLILLDIMMPKLSGFEVCKMLKRDPNTRQIMILMVTALNELGDIERAVAAGCDDFLSKPVNKLELVKRVENHAQAPPGDRRAGAAASLHRQHGRAAARAGIETARPSHLALVFQGTPRTASLGRIGASRGDLGSPTATARLLAGSLR